MLFLWWSALLPLLCLVADFTGSSGEEKAEEVIGALGESVTFQMEIPGPFTTITWLKIQRNGVPTAVAVLKPQENCATTILLPNLEGRLNVSRDCKGLQVKNLNQDDSGTYQAQIQLDGQEEPLLLFFDLRVYKHLSESNLSIHCKGIGNGTWRLNCSAEPWEDGTNFVMTSSSQREVHGRSFDIQQDLEESNLNITCAAKNPVSTASRTESLKEICDNHSPPSSLGVIVGVIVVLSIVACAAALFCWKKRKGDSMQPLDSADSRGCNTIYARVGDVVEERDSHHGQRGMQAAQGKPKMAQTIYTTVDHACKPPPLQNPIASYIAFEMNDLFLFNPMGESWLIMASFPRILCKRMMRRCRKGDGGLQSRKRRPSTRRSPPAHRRKRTKASRRSMKR
ncbi:SLAM family member 9-like isoform X2 [Sceloporus undulatus]|uniref:SLAM family member 9-like isoform X2 n=1 Tax=Sceloporus undulatus TaxID=8520 RepID=UPI001C4ABDA4|nr:SLAM family member 9-like isoform X2 [Sceloporus undulatus]